jgi:hypothetical protein
MKDETKIFITTIVGFSIWRCCIALGPHKPAKIPEQISDYQACLKRPTDGVLERQMLLQECLKVKEGSTNAK